MLGISVIGDVPYQALKLIETLNNVKTNEWFTNLINSAVRVKNILQKSSGGTEKSINESLFTTEAEKNLFAEVSRLDESVNKALEVYDWEELTKMLSELSPVISKFFDEVMVMDKDENIRNNRLALLSQCNKLFREVGDLSVLS